jgi:hypothetical protein
MQIDMNNHEKLMEIAGTVCDNLGDLTRHTELKRLDLVCTARAAMEEFYAENAKTCPNCQGDGLLFEGTDPCGKKCEACDGSGGRAA